MAEGVDFDLLAASLRADAGDLAAFVEALAAKLEGSFPERIRVERTGGLRAKSKRVRSIEVELGDRRYALASERGDIACRRQSVVRGIALKSDELELDAWIDDLARALATVASESERGRLALQRLLER